MIHPATRVIHVSRQVGDGVVASELIPRGTIVWTQDALDRVFDADALRQLDKPLESHLKRYAHVDESGRYVLCWDAGKLINHSCEPTLRGVGTWFQVARRDIDPGEEITCDYAECNIKDALQCLCSTKKCRGDVRGVDLLRFAEEWDEEAHELLSLIPAVEQPLWPFLLHPQEAEGYVKNKQPLPSFRSLYAEGL